MRIAVGGIHTECASANPALQRMADFDILTGERLLATLPKIASVDYLPIFHARSIPGGAVAVDDYQKLKATFLAQLQSLKDIDGVCLLMHGAMLVPGLDDPEGDWIEAVRALRPDLPVTASFDPHGNISNRVTDNLDGFAAYRTAPHIDVCETHARAVSMLARQISTGVRAKVYRQPIPLLVSGEMSSTEFAPMDMFIKQVEAHEQTPHILDANIMVGYVWADDDRATANAIVTATDERAGIAACREIADAYWALRHQLTFSVPVASPVQAFDNMGTPAILCDAGDNPTAGGVGDRADLLDMALQQQRAGVVFPKTLFAGIWTPRTYETLGAQAGGGGPVVEMRVDHMQAYGDCTILTEGSITVIAHKARKTFHRLADFDALGIDIDDYGVLVVKLGYLVPEFAALNRHNRLILTDGAVSQDLAALPNHHRLIRQLPFEA